MLRVIAKRTRQCDELGNLRVDEVSVTAIAASLNETRAFKLGDKFSHFLRHEITGGVKRKSKEPSSNYSGENYIEPGPWHSQNKRPFISITWSE